ncbi:uncharacterized protein LOC100375861 [Saccoglossus kowalevskii]|uniref:Cysteine-rich motor neuron 1 protein-like n=1 Tax=Saccoglossus kowalevskii TaxID=10224 RepID=A0A1L7H7H0_SACKO|nr:PREDICTED: cysteine-rich motor neuron 1 protein-like [Saccoglossus kowalevskii]APU50787.1 cysteine-rich motor neuron 1 protein-like protein 102 [Saccoglossus kowalevskii]
MDSTVTTLLTVILLLAIQNVDSYGDKGKRDGLHCPPCDRMLCKPRKPSRLENKCRGGVTTGTCDCCPACASVEGESCGGKWGSLGKCDFGLECVKPANPNIPPGYYNPLPGVCRSRTDSTVIVSDDPSLCRPKCTSEFCGKNPRAVCSATENANEKRDCQGYCQHTSCRACRFIDPTPECTKCAKDDEDCIMKFGRCVRKNVCSKDKYPCKSSGRYESGSFQCMVPECL